MADPFYTKNILNKVEELSILDSLESNTLQIKRSDLPLPNLRNIGFKENRGGLYYISDIHLDHKIFKAFGKNGSYKKTIRFIEQLINGLLKDDDGNEIQFPFVDTTILIVGDTAHSFELNRIFYETLSRSIPYYKDIFVILGNHELWDFNSVGDAIKAYDEFFDMLPNIHLLQNSLYIKGYYKEPSSLLRLEQERSRIILNQTIPKSTKEKLLKENWEKIEVCKTKLGTTKEEQHKSRIKKSILNQQKLQVMTTDDLRKSCFNSRKIIYGTIGFSPLNKLFNANSGIYRNVIKNIEQERQFADEASSIYKKLSLSLHKNPLIVASHMPLEDWSVLPYQEGWTFFNGHTHNNKKEISDTKCIYADNQIGYYGKRIKFNAIAIGNKIDYFAYYKDGIYDITESDYHNFYNGFSKTMISVDKRGGEKYKIKMLKNNNLYLFLFETEKGMLYLLEGGKRHVLQKQDIEYYYNNLVRLNEVISRAVGSIMEYLKQLSSYIKQIGGSGRIHGNIVDIDFFDHIMVDIRDGSILPYFAFGVTDRYEFPSIPKLLQARRPELYKRYIEYSSDKCLPILKEDNALLSRIEHSNDSSIYHDSNIMIKIQDMIDYNVIRFWNDELIEQINSSQAGTRGIKKQNIVS